MHKLSQRGAIHLLVPIILLLGLVAGVYLVTSGNPLNLFSKATNPPIVFKSLDGRALPLNSEGIPQTDSPEVMVELTSTLGPPISLPGPVSGPNQQGTVSYRTGFDPTMLDSAIFSSYLKEPTVYTVDFPNSLGLKFYWVEFKGANGQTDRRSAQIEVTALRPTPIPSPSSTSTPRPSVTPSPVPSATPTPTPFVCTACAADINKSGKVEVMDLVILKMCFGRDPNAPILGGLKICTPADINKDGYVNNYDYACFEQQYGQICTTGPASTPPPPTPVPTPPSLQNSPKPIGVGGPFSITMSKNPTSITCQVGQTDCFTSTVIGANKIDKPLYNTTVYTTRSSNLRFLGFDGVYKEPGSQSRNTRVIQPGEDFNILVNLKQYNQPGTYNDTLYVDAQTCNLNVSPPDCYSYGATSIPFKITVQ